MGDGRVHSQEVRPRADINALDANLSGENRPNIDHIRCTGKDTDLRNRPTISSCLDRASEGSRTPYLDDQVDSPGVSFG